jgi:hypothetical protein
VSESATERVRAALAAGQAPTRKDWSHYLRESLGLSKSRAEHYTVPFVQAGLVQDEPTEPDTLTAAKAFLDRVASLASNNRS